MAWALLDWIEAMHLENMQTATEGSAEHPSIACVTCDELFDQRMVDDKWLSRRRMR